MKYCDRKQEFVIFQWIIALYFVFTKNLRAIQKKPQKWKNIYTRRSWSDS